MKKVATFSIKQSFQITGRGLVATGQIMEGTIMPGQHISLKIDGKDYLLKVSGVNIGKLNSKGETFVGLLISNDSPNIDINLSSVKLEEQESDIFE